MVVSVIWGHKEITCRAGQGAHPQETAGVQGGGGLIMRGASMVAHRHWSQGLVTGAGS